MGLDIWFVEDIRNALLAANEASGATAAVIAETGADESLTVNLRSYREGFKAALATIALAFGLAPQSIIKGVIQDERQIDSGAGNAGILEATAGDCERIRPPDGQSTGRGAQKADWTRKETNER